MLAKFNASKLLSNLTFTVSSHIAIKNVKLGVSKGAHLYPNFKGVLKNFGEVEKNLFDWKGPIYTYCAPLDVLLANRKVKAL